MPGALAPGGNSRGVDAITEPLRAKRTPSLASLFRLTRDLDVAEDCLSEAVELALLQWPTRGTPARPGAWLSTVARRKALDRMRRDQVLSRKLPQLLDDEPEADDDRLSLVFTCCH